MNSRQQSNPPVRPERVRRAVGWGTLRRLLVWGGCFAVLFLVGLWSVGAVHYAYHWPGAATAVYAGGLLAFWIVSFRRRRWLYMVAAVELTVAAVFFSMTPQRAFAGTDWQAQWGRVPSVEFLGSRVVLHNVRDFRYRSVDDYDIRYIDFEFDPSTVRTVDLAVSHWDGMRAIAHTMLSFGFADGRYLVVSMETRVPKGAAQGFLPGFYRQYELIMVLGVEEDLFKLRTDFRREDLYLYRTNATAAQARKLLGYVVLRAESLSLHPEFYNSVTRNCTTSLSPLLRVIDPTFGGDIRLLFNGYSDELLFELGYLKYREDETFADLKKRRAADYCLSQPSNQSYSERLRFDL